MESYPFVIWWVFSIDTHSVLTGSGRGDFVETMLASDMLPSLRIINQGSGVRVHDLSSAPEDHPGSSALEFHRSILILAARLGLLARDLRQTVAQSYRRQTQVSHAEAMQRRQRVEQLRNCLRRTWEAQLPTSDAMSCCNELVPVKSRGILEHVSCSQDRQLTSSPI